MNRIFLVAAVALMIAALAFLNQGIKKDSPTDQDLQQQSQAQQQAQKPPQGAANGSPPPTKTAASTLHSEEAVGDPAKARHHIQVGWVYDEANQADPVILAGPIQVVRDYVNKSGGAASAEIVNLDIPVEDRSPAAKGVNKPGILVDGRSAMPGDFSEMHITAPDITKALDAAGARK